jgi:hypothetical protein
MATHAPAHEYLPSVVPCWHHPGLRKRRPLSHCPAPTLQVLECLPKAKGVLVTAGGEGSSYAFKGANGKVDLRGRVPVLKVGPHYAPDVHAAVCVHAATSACRPGRQWQRPLGSCVAILQVDVMDTTGAGDGFLGGFLHHTVKKGAPPPSASACPLWGLQQTVCWTHCCCSTVVT